MRTKHQFKNRTFVVHVKTTDKTLRKNVATHDGPPADSSSVSKGMCRQKTKSVEE